MSENKTKIPPASPISLLLSQLGFAFLHSLRHPPPPLSLLLLDPSRFNACQIFQQNPNSAKQFHFRANSAFDSVHISSSPYLTIGPLPWRLAAEGASVRRRRPPQLAASFKSAILYLPKLRGSLHGLPRYVPLSTGKVCVFLLLVLFKFYF